MKIERLMEVAMGQKKKGFLRRLLFILTVISLFLCTACAQKQKNQYEIQPTEDNATRQESQNRDFLAVVKQVDTENNQILLQNVSQNREAGLSISGGTKILSKNGKQMVITQLCPGDLLDVYIESGTATASILQIASDVKSYDSIENMTINSEEKYVSIGTKKFRYEEGIVVLSEGKLIDLMEIAPTDVVTVKGQEGKVYSIIVEKGHGYIRPKNYEDFIGGKMTIDGETIIDITENMLVPIREGIYEITMKKGGYIGTRSIQVEKNKESEMDMSLYKNQPENMGQVVLDIEPDGAEVYLEGKEVEYDLPVSLAYGKHKIKVILEGYTSYEGVLDVASANPTVRINLAKEEAEVDTGQSSTPSPSAETSSAQTVYDDEHTITVQSPAGAEVYLNGVYKGTAPVSFKKVVGTQTITLSKSGYITKSYTVDTLLDGEDIQWNFADLEKAS